MSELTERAREVWPYSKTVTEMADALERVEKLAEKWRYKGEFGRGPWQEGHGPDHEGWILDRASAELSDALGGK